MTTPNCVVHEALYGDFLSTKPVGFGADSSVVAGGCVVVAPPDPGDTVVAEVADGELSCTGRREESA